MSQTPEERLLQMILDEMKDQKSEIKGLRNDIQQHELDIDRLKTKMALIAGGVSAITAIVTSAIAATVQKII